MIVAIIVLLLATTLTTKADEQQKQQHNHHQLRKVQPEKKVSSYGVDVSFPMHHLEMTDHDGLPNRQEFYREYIAGCHKRYAGRKGGEEKRCTWTENDRIEMNLKQPRDMHNYTSAGYAKVAAPPEVTQLLLEFWDRGRDQQEREKWPKGNTYVNHWDANTYIVELDDEVKDQVVTWVQPILEAWTDQSLIVTSVYGIRVYKNGAVLAPHVDRLPLVSSCILNVAQDVDEDWPLEVIGHDGIAVNVTSHPGDMILYESHSVIHGRPFPMKGRFFANVFVHFEPYRYTEKHALRGSFGADEDALEDLEGVYSKAEKRSEHEYIKSGGDIPHYVDEEKEEQWRQQFVYQPERRLPKGEVLPNPNEPEGMSPHTAAALGKIGLLEQMYQRDPALLTNPDANGWRPIHEAARSGETATLKYLVSKGANINERTNDGRGATPLFWAEQMLDQNHPAVQYLKEQGAINKAPQRAGEKGSEL